ncbi:MAG: type II toxin-antitoxin system YafQ family toxin [Oscillospiraceae bacterium]|nr:type II toxin-antitoxin system YafQ family toxin [Oscillospiraceae bacterium]
MNKLRYTLRFRRDYRWGLKKGCDGGKLRALLELLRLGSPLPQSAKDSSLPWAEARACRVEPGWILVYRAREGAVTLLRIKYVRKERPSYAPPMKLWFKTLLRSPVKTALTVLLLAAACFLLLDNLSSYVMQTEAIQQAEKAAEGVLTVERSQVRNPWDGTRSTFLLSDPTNPGETYREDCSYDSTHHEALSVSDLEALEALPYIDAMDRRYMTAGVSEDYYRIDGAYADYGYMDRLVIEATVASIGQGALIDQYKYDSAWRYILDDVNVLAGDRKTLDQQYKALGGKARLIVNTLPESALGTGTRVYLGGMAGDGIDCLDYDITKEQAKDIKAGRRYVFVVRAPRYEAPDSSTFGFLLGDDSRKGWWPYFTDITDLRSDYLKTEEFASLCQLIQVTNEDIRTFDVVYTDDMTSIRRAARKQLTAAQGRFLTPADEGSPVCVVSERFLAENGLRLGDTITLKLGNYLMEQYQPLGAVAVTLGRYATEWEEHTFTIVGTWQDTGDSRWQVQEHYSYYSTGSLQEQDLFWAYSVNAIFVPASFLPASCDTENHVFRPGEVSFLVRDAGNIGAFAEECLPLVEEMGLRYAWNDAGWPLVAEKMKETRSLTLMKLLIFTIAALLAVGLTLYLFLHRRRREYAILRALGTPRRAAAKALWLPLIVLAAIAAAIGTGAAWFRSGAAAARSAAEFAEAGLEAMPAARICVYLLGAFGLLLLVALLAALYLRVMGKRSPLALLQDGNRKQEKKGGIQSTENSPEALAAAASVLAVPMTVTGKPIRGFLRRYVFRHVRRAGVKTLLTLLLAALLVGAVGQLTVLRSRYGEMMQSVRVEADFFDGLSLYRAETLLKSGMVRDPVYQTRFPEAELELELAEVVFTNRWDSVISDPVIWLEGWDEESAIREKGRICILPAPIMEKLGVKLGDAVRINEFGCIQYLAYGHNVTPINREEGVALRDRYRPFYTVVGRVETEQENSIVFAPISAFGSYSFFGTTLYLDSAAFTLNDYHDADKVRQLAAEIQYTVKKPPVFSMDTSDADRIYRIYRLIETLYPLTVAAALILGTLLPVLMILQEQKEAAILRALGWSKKLTIRRLTLEQAVLCMAGLILAIAALFAVNGLGFLGVILVPILYVIAHFALCVTASAAISASILQKSPMRLLQAKE